MGRVLTYGFWSLIGLVTILALAILLWLDATKPDYSKTLKSDHLGADVTITRDEFGIPHITADSFEDAAFAMGYAQAQDRFWQMELMRRSVHGRTGEAMGEAFYPMDLRTKALLDFPGVLDKTDERLDPEVREVFRRFAEGINLAVATGQAASSPEWDLLGVPPEEWTARDVSGFLIAVMQEPWASDGARELEEAYQAKYLTAEENAFFFQDAPATFPTLYEDLTNKPERQASYGRPDPDVRRTGGGTNFFVVGPDKTAEGTPILAVDPHLPTYAPGVVYPVSITLPDDFIAGGAWVGTPAVTFGHNSRIAWGMTHLYADAEDFIIERIDPNSTDHYLTPEGPKRFEEQQVTLNGKDGSSKTVTVRSSENGIIVSDKHLYEDGVVPPPYDLAEKIYGPGHVIARRQVNTEVGLTSIQAIVKVSRATDWNSFRDALRDFENTNNLVYADVDGNIGVQMSARLPIREQKNGWNGQRPARGWLGEGKWRGYVPFDELPNVYNPPKGWVADSNSRAVNTEFAYRLTSTYSPAWRIRRAYDLMDARDDHTMDTIIDAQLDVFSGQSEWLLSRVRDLPVTSDKAKGALSLLRDWDHKMHADLPEPLLYSAFELALQERLVNDQYDAVAGSNADVLRLGRILEADHAWCDDTRTTPKESCTDTVTAALESAVDRLSAAYGPDMSKWRWGDAHQASFPAFFSWAHVPVLDEMTATHIGTSGGPGTLNVGSMGRSGVPKDDLLAGLDFTQTMGSTYRMVADMSDLKNSQFMVVPGVAGNALSPHWADQVDPWARGDYFTLQGREPKRARTTVIAATAGTE